MHFVDQDLLHPRQFVGMLEREFIEKTADDIFGMWELDQAQEFEDEMIGEQQKDVREFFVANREEHDEDFEIVGFRKIAFLLSERNFVVKKRKEIQILLKILHERLQARETGEPVFAKNHFHRFHLKSAPSW